MFVSQAHPPSGDVVHVDLVIALVNVAQNERSDGDSSVLAPPLAEAAVDDNVAATAVDNDDDDDDDNDDSAPTVDDLAPRHGTLLT